MELAIWYDLLTDIHGRLIQSRRQWFALLFRLASMVEPWKYSDLHKWFCLFDIAYHLVVHVWNCTGIGRLYIKIIEIPHPLPLLPSEVIFGAREISCDVYSFSKLGSDRAGTVYIKYYGGYCIVRHWGLVRAIP